MPNRVTTTLNDLLLQKFTEEEVKNAVFQMKGRAITDNIMVVYETLRSMSTRIQGKSTYMALKLNMSKAYDGVEWDFLSAIMCKMGFDSRWIALVMNYIKSISYLIVLNGEAQASFKPTRGLSMIFCKASTLEWRRMLSILTVYEQASGQLLNKEKSAIYFNRNTPNEYRANITRIAGVTLTTSFEKYLGLPTMVGRTKVACFHGLIDRMWSKINNWKTNKLSAVGKKVLLKSVLQAIPTYTMGIFLLPKSITNRLEQILRKFWWSFS
ncbi:uncharacterized protein LOC122278427 [Carya illinoinensis]|uniref:uncharacterized protein LOC122278427 n=1 Tax=Carya illinoinensis TaxID=32201 RepID=UPI001C71D604|nr:uncharacterized protein LOC122278427 [Carya illinoinensis]